MIISKTNLHPDRFKHHNVGYSNLSSGYGFIYDGIEWKSESISVIVDNLIRSKERDLLQYMQK